MTICLVVQKDTLENNKVKSLLKNVDETPEDFVNNLQEGHCIPYQLIAHCPNDSKLTDRLIRAVGSHKTNFGKDWYDLDHEVLSKVISLFLENDKTVLNIKLVSSIFGFSFQLFPIVTKEIKITENKKEEIVTLIETLQESESKRKVKKSSKKE